MEDANKGIEIRLADLWSILKRCWWMMLAVLIVVFAVTYIITVSTHVDEYTASATVWALGSNASGSGNTTTSDVSIGTYLVKDYQELILTPGVLEEVLQKASISGISATKLRSMISVTNSSGSRVLTISVTTTDKTTSAKLANTLVDVFCNRINAKNEDGKTLVTPWDAAQTPKKSSNPISMFKVILIAFVSAIAVYGVFFVMYLLDDKISTADDVEKYLGVNILGVIPNRIDASRRRSRKR